jgi:hypothetical protein
MRASTRSEAARVRDAGDPAVEQIGEFDYPKFDELVLAMIKTDRFGVDQDTGLNSCPMTGIDGMRGTSRRSTL